MTIKYVDAFKANDGSLYIRLNPRTFWGKICIRLLQKRAYFCKRYTWACSCWPSFPNAGLGTDGIDVWWPGIYYLLNVRGLLFINFRLKFSKWRISIFSIEWLGKCSEGRCQCYDESLGGNGKRHSVSFWNEVGHDLWKRQCWHHSNPWRLSDVWKVISKQWSNS